MVNIGDGVSDRTKVLINAGIDGSISKDWKWP